MPGYPSLVVGMMVIGGVQLLMIGVLGEYIGKLLSEIKARPVYFVAEHSVKHADAAAKETAKAARRRPRARRSKRNVTDGRRRIWLCADDYGISPSVNAAIRELILRGRINATSVMVAAPHLGADEADALDVLNSGEQRAALGLHVTLTAPFKPLSADFAPLRHGHFPPLQKMMRAAMTRRLNPERLTIEVATQVRSLCHGVRPSARLHRRPPARASVSAGARCRAQGGGGDGARCVGQAMRPSALGAAAEGPQGTAARHFERRLSPQGAAARRRHQSGLCRRL